MNVSLENNGASGIIKINIVKADYAEKVNKSLHTFRKQANVPGFRKGMVPMGMINKMYGKSALLEEVNKLVSENLIGYIRENKLNILGEPLPNEDLQKPLDFDKDEEFEFCFDIAIAPEINIELDKRNKFTTYDIAITDEMIKAQTSQLTMNFSTMEQVEDVEESDLVKGRLVELENGEPKEGGIQVEDALIMPLYVKNDEEKQKLVAAKKNSVIVINPNKAYEGAESELAYLLGVEKEKVAEVKSDFSYEIKEISRRKAPEMNQELFDNVFGKDVVKSEEEFTAKVKEQILDQFNAKLDFQFMKEARESLVHKAGEVVLADDLLKRWLVTSNEKNTPESIEKDYPKIKEDLVFHLVKESLIKRHEVKVEETEVLDFAKQVASAQFAQYGMMSVPEEQLVSYAKQLLQNEETKGNILDRVIEKKLVACIKGLVKLDVVEISAEDFDKKFMA